MGNAWRFLSICPFRETVVLWNPEEQPLSYLGLKALSFYGF